MSEIKPEQILDMEKVSNGINALSDSIQDLELTVAEAIHVIHCMDATLKAKYPEAYEFMHRF